jgi:hypothetical protein
MLGSWLYWSVPAEKARHYVIVMTLMMYIVPEYLFGIRFTTLGYLMNFLLYDATYYFVHRVEQAMKDYHDRDRD